VGQLLNWLNASLVNTLLTTASLCRAGTAYSTKVSLSHIEQWIAASHTTQLIGDRAVSLCTWLSDRLEALREAANVLVVDKSVFMSPDLSSIFVVLNTAQISRLLTQFQTDEYANKLLPTVKQADPPHLCRQLCAWSSAPTCPWCCSEGCF